MKSYTITVNGNVYDVTVEFVMLYLFFFFFKQKTAYEIMPSLVGSEMCIRDRTTTEK